MAVEQHGYAAITDDVVVWGRATNALAFWLDKGSPTPVQLFALQPDDYQQLESHGWVGVAAERIAQRGGRVSFEVGA